MPFLMTYRSHGAYLLLPNRVISSLTCPRSSAYRVVQSGAEFSDAKVFDYDPAKTSQLREYLSESPSLVFEAHSTDYQTRKEEEQFRGE